MLCLMHFVLLHCIFWSTLSRQVFLPVNLLQLCLFFSTGLCYWRDGIFVWTILCVRLNNKYFYFLKRFWKEKGEIALQGLGSHWPAGHVRSTLALPGYRLVSWLNFSHGFARLPNSSMYWLMSLTQILEQMYDVCVRIVDNYLRINYKRSRDWLTIFTSRPLLSNSKAKVIHAVSLTTDST